MMKKRMVGPVRIIIGMYQVQKTVINDGKETLWSLWETKSDQIIGAFFTQAQAREAQKFFTEVADLTVYSCFHVTQTL